MQKMNGFDYAKENGYITETDEFYKLFKKIVRLKTITSTEKIILSIIMSYTGNGMEFYMSNNTLAMETGMDYSSAVRTISSLRAKGFIKTFKVIDKTKNTIIGRVAVPQKQFVKDQVVKTWNQYEYEEYEQFGF